jgi:hypothetical protein
VPETLLQSGTENWARQGRLSFLLSDNLTFKPVAWIFTDYAKLKGLRPEAKTIGGNESVF